MPTRDDALRVLVLDEVLPWPTNTGKRLRTFNLLTVLANTFQIELVVHRNEATPEALSEFASRGIIVHVAPSRIAEKRGVLLPFRILASLAARLPYSVYSHQLKGYQATVSRLLRERQYALIHCEWTPYTVYTRNVTLPLCVAAHNVEWLIWHRMAETETRPLHRTLFWMQELLMRNFEKQVFARIMHATAVSADDEQALRALGCRDVVTVPNGVDGERYTPFPATAEEPRTLVFTGSLDWRPNQDAIAWFIKEIHPILIKRTNYRFYVVGRTPPEWMRDPDVVPPELTVTGTVDDIRPWIAKGSVYVVPLRAGGGSRLKILEALAMARAVVSTTIGMEGLDIEPGRHLLAADTPEEFTTAICELFENPAARSELGRAGRERIDAVYQWSQIAPLQAELWNRIAGVHPAGAGTSSQHHT